MELAEGTDEGVEVLGCDGLQGRLHWASFSFHGVDCTRSSNGIFEQPPTPLTLSVRMGYNKGVFFSRVTERGVDDAKG